MFLVQRFKRRAGGSLQPLPTVDTEWLWEEHGRKPGESPHASTILWPTWLCPLALPGLAHFVRFIYVERVSHPSKIT